MEVPILLREIESFLTGPDSARLATLKDKEVAAEFSARVVGITVPLTPKQFLDSLTSVEFTMWSGSKNVDAVTLLFYVTAGESIDTATGTPCRVRLDALALVNGFGPIVTKLLATAGTTQHYWQSVGCEREANHGDVAWVRREVLDG